MENISNVYREEDYETTELLYEVVRLKAPKDKSFDVKYKSRDENKPGSTAIFIYDGPNQRTSLSNVVHNTAKAHIEVTVGQSEEFAHYTSVFLTSWMHNLEKATSSGISNLKLKRCKHSGTGPIWVKRNQFGFDIYKLDIEIQYIFKHEL